MNPSERFHPSPLGFCVDKRRGKVMPLCWKGCLRASVTLLNPQPLWHSPCVNTKLQSALPVSACANMLLLHFAPECVSMQVLLMHHTSDYTRIFFYLYYLYEHLLFSCLNLIPLSRCATTVLSTWKMEILLVPSGHTHYLNIWSDYPQQCLLHTPAEGFCGTPGLVIRKSPWLHIWKKKDFCLAQ